MRDSKQNHIESPIPVMENNSHGKIENKLIDLNARPQRIHGQNSTNQVYPFPLTIMFVFFSLWLHIHMHAKKCSFMHEIYILKKLLGFVCLKEQGIDVMSSSNHESASVVPVGSFKREHEK